ncbi:alpha/beta-hydrolase [Stipitochalara longipes BDJ]|nr:alpha/beta-hydrolase [Stipitochalara longipes BDJ]
MDFRGANFSGVQIPPSKHVLTWYSCFDDFLCAVLEVPLNYQKPKEGKSLVPLINYPAKKTPYKGMILANPGGPGLSGVDLIRSLASQDIPFFGLDYDFVSWDPRGCGYAIPAGDCALTNLTIPLGPAATMKRRDLDKLHGPSLPEGYFENVYKVAYELGQECTNSIGGPLDSGPHMSSTTIARDMLSIVDAYANSWRGQNCEDDASLLNYWGMSYGTFLGQVFASLFPDRVGRVVLDGVLDPDEISKESGLKMVTQADEAFSTLFLYCHLAGPTLCPFYTGTTPHDIYLRFENIVTQLNVTQALEQNWANSTAMWLVLQGMKEIFDTYAYHAIDNFPTAALILTAVETLFPNITLEAVENLEKELPGALNPPLTINVTWSTGTACADNGGRYIGQKVSEWADSIAVMESESWISGESQIVNQMFCAGWNITTAERYGGPFGGNTKNPILFVSNTLDPITPIVNGQKGTRIFKDAQLLTIEGVAHTSLPTKNACSLAKIGAFLMNGTLLGANNYCPLEAGPWGVLTTGPLAKRSEVAEISRLMRGLRRK